MNTELIEKFYKSFSIGDADHMISCYHEKIVFTDPAFGTLHGSEVANMWRMLIENSKGNLNITFSDVRADEKKGEANWVAKYVFSKTGKKVINKIHAQFEFEDGKIIRHIDRFNLWKWSSQALGWKGLLFGWTPMVKNKINHQAKSQLNKYIKAKQHDI